MAVESQKRTKYRPESRKQRIILESIIHILVISIGLLLLGACANRTEAIASDSFIQTEAEEMPMQRSMSPAADNSLNLTHGAGETFWLSAKQVSSFQFVIPAAEEGKDLLQPVYSISLQQSISMAKAVNMLPEESNTGKSENTIPQTGMTASVPEAYTQPCDRPGSIQRLVYESRDYTGSGASIKKTAYVYLPYGYDETDVEKQYDILYLMHGWMGYAGEFFDNGATKNILDHLIDKGDVLPMIVVSPSFYNRSRNIDFDASLKELRSFYTEFESHLMPAVEEKYHTYALSVSKDDLQKSRDHRAWGGFSMGAVTTWLMFCYESNYIRWFLPMSGSCMYYGDYDDYQTRRNVDYIESIVEGNDLNALGYFIYHAVGTNDSYKEQSFLQSEEMLARRDVFTPDHYVFYMKEQGQHDRRSVDEFLYNALPLFFR